MWLWLTVWGLCYGWGAGKKEQICNWIFNLFFSNSFFFIQFSCWWEMKCNDRNGDFIGLLSSLPASSLRTYNMDITYIILYTLCSARVFPFFFQLNGDSNADSVAAVVSSACYSPVAFISLANWQCINSLWIIIIRTIIIQRAKNLLGNLLRKSQSLAETVRVMWELYKFVNSCRDGRETMYVRVITMHAICDNISECPSKMSYKYALIL